MHRRQCIAWLAGAAALSGARGAAAAEPICIGQTLPLSGNFGPLVASIREGQDALFDEVNARASDEEKTLANCSALIQRDKVASESRRRCEGRGVRWGSANTASAVKSKGRKATTPRDTACPCR